MNISPQLELESLLKFKGIGPKGSKCLSSEQIERLTFLMLNSEVSLATKATFLTAFKMLDNTEEEQHWLDTFIQFENNNRELKNLFSNESEFGKLISQVVEKKDLNKVEAKKGMDFLLDKKNPPYQKACFLEAERLKRETHEENLAFLEAMWVQSDRIQTSEEQIIDIADNYDGYNRTPCFTPFVATILAACGYKVIFHGVETLAPKHGVTSHNVLKSAGKKVDLNLKEGLVQLEQINLVYIDQSVSFPNLFELRSVRQEMVKRPLLATFEKWMQPIRASNGNLMAMGYTHSAYKTMLAKIVKDFGKTDKSMIIRGIEGSPRPPLSRDATVMWYDGEETHEEFFRAEEYGLKTQEEPVDKQLTAEDSYQRGFAVLKGEKNIDRDMILYWCVSLLSGFRLLTDLEAIEKIEKVLDSGTALELWKRL